MDLTKVKVVAAPVAPAYAHPQFGMQFTGGSQSVASEWDRLRRAGATAREMLVQPRRPTPGRWIGPPCAPRTGGSCAPAAGPSPTGSSSTRLAPSRCRRRSRSRTRRSSRSSASRRGASTAAPRSPGRPRSESTSTVPGMLVAVVARPPVFGGTPKTFGADRARAVRGVKQRRPRPIRRGGRRRLVLGGQEGTRRARDRVGRRPGRRGRHRRARRRVRAPRPRLRARAGNPHWRRGRRPGRGGQAARAPTTTCPISPTPRWSP